MTKYAKQSFASSRSSGSAVRAQEELSELRHGAREGLYAARHAFHVRRWSVADALLRTHRLLPVEEEGRLNDPRLRESFIERVFAYHRLQKLFRERWTIADLVRFQEHEKVAVDGA